MPSQPASPAAPESCTYDHELLKHGNFVINYSGAAGEAGCDGIITAQKLFEGTQNFDILSYVKSYPPPIPWTGNSEKFVINQLISLGKVEGFSQNSFEFSQIKSSILSHFLDLPVQGMGGYDLTMG